MILICLAINLVCSCSEMTVLGFRSSLLVIIIIIENVDEEYKQIEDYSELYSAVQILKPISDQ